MAGLRVGDVKWERQTLSVVGARMQGGGWKDYPKSSKSRREVPVPIAVLELLRELADDRPEDADAVRDAAWGSCVVGGELAAGVR